MRIDRLADLRVAVVHEFLVEYGGSERVAEVMLEAFPHADFFVLHTEPGRVPQTMLDRVTHVLPISKWIRRLPFDFRTYTPIYPYFVEHWDFGSYDLVVSSSHFCAKSFIKPSSTCHVSYCHTPLRQTWDRYHDYCREFSNPISRSVFRMFAHYFRIWDEAAAQRVDSFLCCSRKIAARIEAAYRREAEVLYPPVDIPVYDNAPLPEEYRRQIGDGPYFLVISRLINAYKRIDLALAAIEKIPGGKLVVVGTGPDERKIRQAAGANTIFLGAVYDTAIKAALIRNSTAVVIPGDEDFGIVAFEAISCARPVVVYRNSGAAEILEEGKTGAFFSKLNADEIAQAMRRAAEFAPGAAADGPNLVRKFCRESFKNAMLEHISSAYEEFRDRRHALSTDRRVPDPIEEITAQLRRQEEQTYSEIPGQPR